MDAIGKQREKIVAIHFSHVCVCVCVGMDMLTNVQRGHVYGCVCSWRMNRRRQLGVHLLYKAYRTFLIYTPQELFLEDI